LRDEKEDTAMRRPNAAGIALQALEPLAQKVTELEGKALRGESMELVRIGEELAEAAREAGRRAVEMILDQAARAEPAHGSCGCGGHRGSRGFEPRSVTPDVVRILGSDFSFTRRLRSELKLGMSSSLGALGSLRGFGWHCLRLRLLEHPAR
jgi:hypothetical protein